ncbi:S-layer homology domain-containing protein [Tissierella praeacuta]|uniref:S-layer homology domain-containing protein n=1 Tax=Tissierella praeacuta TaxID=43131 RepID=UPI001C115CA8|nr:S-layer homology domain-containing protein [Tissierella praeacuta]MBU5255185.1 S-layer homology domain-containing protein [Tissierella praeacuta]
MKYRSKRIINILLVVCILMTNFIGSVYAAKHIFSDSIGHWAEETIDLLTERGIIQGYPDGLSHPDNVITRGEFSALLARTMKLETKDRENVGLVFEDIIGHFAQKEIEALVYEGIILVEDYGKLYIPNKPISRMEIIKMLVRATGKENHNPDCSCNTGFIDEENLAKEEIEYICLGKQYNIISGYPDRTIRPNGESTRAEAFTMLIKQEKAKEKIEGDKAKNKDKNEQEKPTIPPKPTDKPTDNKPDRDRDTENSSSSGNGSNYVPAPKYSFELPLTAYVDEEIKIIPKASNVKSVTWEISKDGIPVDLLSVIDGELKTDGGTIKIKSVGSYNFTATAVNSRGKEVKHEQTIDIYPVVSAEFKLPETAHTDTTIDVELSTENLGDNPVAWSVQRDGKEIDFDTNITGELTNTGGLITFNNTGIYELTAVITDELGKEIKVSDVIKIYPVGEIKLELDKITYTDKNITLRTETKNTDDMDLIWSLTRNGEEVNILEFIEGNISLENSIIGFKEKGVYNLILSAIDKTGRTFTDKVSITVYPVGSAGFYLPEIFHTDDEIKIEAAFEEIGNRDAEWSLIKDGKEVELSDFVSGNLSNDGGIVTFPYKGEYILKASFTDDGGRIYDYEQSFKVYPVLAVGYTLPKYAHTDSYINVEVNSTELDGLEVEWLVDNTFGFQDWSTYVEGNLNNSGGSIRFKRAGVYELVARITDEIGRVFLFETGDKVEVLPVLDIGFELPRLAYTDSIINIRTYGNNNVLPVEWSITKDNKVISENQAISGSLNAQGGKITFLTDGNYILTATMTDFLERSFSYSQEITINPVIEYSFTMPDSIHYGREFEVKAVSENLGTNKVRWTLEKTGKTVDFNGELANEGGKISISDTGEFTLIATIIDGEGRVFTHKKKITITNTAPTVTLTATPTRAVKNGKFFVDIKATASDPDGDATTLEYEGTTSDNYYSVGTHTIRVRAKDSVGAYSPWVEKSFTIKNSPPTTPVITRTPSGNSVAPGTKVTITAKSTDADNDPITYVWEGRNAETQVYPLGKNTVRVKAVDSTGAESPWAAIVFFVADPNGSGGMMLTGPDSVILENGLEGATITEYTFTVPPVAGHSGSDYGRVRGYNVKTKQWDELDYGTTSNGITFVKSLSAGMYSKLEFYYYTNHNCMYDKSNITYSVSYHFE